MLSNIIKEYKFRRRFKLLHKRPLSYYIEKSKNTPRVTCESKVIVTFTTIPERINHIDAMLKSILDQSVLPDKICLCIPKLSRITNAAYPIPEWFKDVPLLEVIETEIDLGPITKLIPSWQKEGLDPETRIIIVDDDMLYPKGLIASLVSWSNRFPNMALGCSGVKVPFGFTPSQIIFNKIDYLNNLRYTPSSSKGLISVDYLFGYAGMLLRSRFVTHSILDYTNAPKGAFFEDDLWIGGNLSREGIDRCVIPSPNDRLMPGSNKKTLETRALCLVENVGGDNMDVTFQHLFKYGQSA